MSEPRGWTTREILIGYRYDCPDKTCKTAFVESIPEYSKPFHLEMTYVCSKDFLVLERTRIVRNVNEINK